MSLPLPGNHGEISVADRPATDHRPDAAVATIGADPMLRRRTETRARSSLIHPRRDNTICVFPQRRVRRARRGRRLHLESLESRALLATTAETFTGPSLSDLIQQAQNGQDTAPAAISRMEQALEDAAHQRSAGGPRVRGGRRQWLRVRGAEPRVELRTGSRPAALPRVPERQRDPQAPGPAGRGDVVSLNQQNAAGLNSGDSLASEAETAIDSLTNGAINALSTPLSGYTSTTQDLVANIANLAQSLSSTTSSSLTPAQASATALAETQAYQAELHAGLQVLHPNVSSEVDAAVSTLESAESGIAQDAASTAGTNLTSAVAGFDSALLGTGGIFVSSGAVSAGDRAQCLLLEPVGSPGRVGDDRRLWHGDPGRDGDLDRHAHLVGLRAEHRGCDRELHARRGLRGDRGDRTAAGSRRSAACRPATPLASTAEASSPASPAISLRCPPASTGDLTVQAATTLGSVSGTASYGGTATPDRHPHLDVHRRRACRMKRSASPSTGPPSAPR